MNIHDATEVAYRNGYKAGYQAGVKEFGKMLIDKSVNGIINISDIPDYVVEMAGDTDDR